jgi:hypothetical protein
MDQIERLTGSLEKMLIAAAMEDVQMSAASKSIVGRAIVALEVSAGGKLELPDMRPYLPSFELPPFDWGRHTELSASPWLQKLLQEWVTTGTDISNQFYDTRPHSSSSPIVFVVEGVAKFRGVPDLVIAKHKIRRKDAMVPLVKTSAVSIDWKTPKAMDNLTSIAAIAETHALAFATASDYKRGIPVFFTDLKGGFRCWIVLNSTIYYLHPDDCDLSLAEGVALIRLFLQNGAVGLLASVQDGQLVFLPPTLPPAGSGTSAGGSGAAIPPSVLSVSPFTPGPKGGHPSAGVYQSGLLSKDVSPEHNAADVYDDDMDTIVMRITAELTQGGGFPRITIQNSEC